MYYSQCISSGAFSPCSDPDPSSLPFRKFDICRLRRHVYQTLGDILKLGESSRGFPLLSHHRNQTRNPPARHGPLPNARGARTRSWGNSSWRSAWGPGMLAIIVQVQNIGLLWQLPGLAHLRVIDTAPVIPPSFFTFLGGMLVIVIVHKWRIVHVIVLEPPHAVRLAGVGAVIF